MLAILVTGTGGVKLFAGAAVSTVGDECRLQLASDGIGSRSVHISDAIIEASARAMTLNKSAHGSPRAIVGISCAIARELRLELIVQPITVVAEPVGGQQRSVVQLLT